MHRQIWQTVWTKRNRRLPSTRRKLALLLLAFMAIFAYNYDRTRAFSTLRPEDVPLLPLAGVQRLLVISPHPDDETLGAAGAIQQALEAGVDVKVVLITNGDGQAVAPLVLQRRVRARAEDYIQTGEQRQTETVSALRLLGVSSDSVLFLGYPDGLINQLWINDWTESCPLRARYTRALHSLYPTTFNSQATYCGRDLLDDLQTIIENYRPDLVLLPHPNDDHPDHRASNNFTRLALALVAEAHPDYRPDVWSYLIHYGLYPQPRGRRPHDSLRPPRPLTGSQNQWARLDLTPDQVKAKAAAVQAYPTQLRLLGSFLPSFVRQNELFTRLDNLDVSPLALVDLPVNASGLIESPAVPEPADESTRQLVVGSADLVGFHVARLDNLLWLTAETRHSLFRGIRYTLMVKLPNGDTLTAAWPGDAVRLSHNTFTFPLNLDEIGDPDVLGFAAEVRQGVVLDHTAWHFITLRNRLP